jgi:hypothetical protein
MGSEQKHGRLEGQKVAAGGVVAWHGGWIDGNVEGGDVGTMPCLVRKAELFV